MLGDIVYHNPTKLYFGEHALDHLQEELAGYGPVVMLSYGGGSIKRNGIYDAVTAVLRAAGKTVVEDPGVMPNPTLEKLLGGAKMAREHHVDLILAVGGGSVVDYAKGVAASAWCEEDRGSVITNRAAGLKVGKVFGPENYPRFSILNPRFTFTVPQYQMVSGIFDIMSHILEQYLSGADDNTSDYLAEGLMRSLVVSSRAAVMNPEDYEARSNIMWTATWALNTLLKMGKAQDWEVHMIGQAIGAITDATHGMTLAAVSLPYYRHILRDGLPRFVRFAEQVWGVRPEGKTPLEIASEGLSCLEAWMKEIGVVLHAAELGVTEENIPAIVKGTFLLDGGYRQLTPAEVADILRESL